MRVLAEAEAANVHNSAVPARFRGGEHGGVADQGLVQSGHHPGPVAAGERGNPGGDEAAVAALVFFAPDLRNGGRNRVDSGCSGQEVVDGDGSGLDGNLPVAAEDAGPPGARGGKGGGGERGGCAVLVFDVHHLVVNDVVVRVVDAAAVGARGQGVQQ